ncbi:MAG: hypothetical protein LUH22_00825 [Bacteroides sp.]|nr:hypothetical protein [Bacteroides sp.]
MTRFKQIFCVLLFTISPMVVAIAQYNPDDYFGSNNTNSPYSRYGFGELANQGFANTRGMGGVAYGVRDRYHINPVNPASYTTVDSLTFLMEAGVSLQNTNFNDGNTRVNVGNSSFDYAAVQFRLHRRLGITLGLLPFSNVSYNFSRSYEASDESSTPYSVAYTGDGGYRQVFLGLGFKVFNNLSIGANVSYLWGETKKRRYVYLNSTSYSFVETSFLKVNDYKLDFGVQYTHTFNPKNVMTIGAVFSPGKELNNTTTIKRVASVTDTKDSIATYEIPMSYGAGITYTYDRKLTLGVDYTFQKWGESTFMNQKNAFYDRTKVAVGLEYLPDYNGTSYFSHIKYRVGAYYSLPYYKAQENGETFRAAKEYGITAGLSLPVPKSLSRVNLAAQYIKVSGQRTNMVDEQYFKLSIGVTFNERWFFKRKVN